MISIISSEPKHKLQNATFIPFGKRFSWDPNFLHTSILYQRMNRLQYVQDFPAQLRETKKARSILNVSNTPLISPTWIWVLVGWIAVVCILVRKINFHPFRWCNSIITFWYQSIGPKYLPNSHLLWYQPHLVKLCMWPWTKFLFACFVQNDRLYAPSTVTMWTFSICKKETMIFSARANAKLTFRTQGTKPHGCFIGLVRNWSTGLHFICPNWDVNPGIRS